MTANPTTLPIDKVAYLTGRRDALKSMYAVVTGRPNLLRGEMVELLRQAVLDSERKLRDATKS